MAVAAGQSHGLGLASDTSVWAWGWGEYGQLGNGTTTYANNQVYSETPVHVSNLTGVTAVAAGAIHSLALTASGTVWAWGDDGSGQLGVGTTTGPQTCYPNNPCSMVPVQVSNLSGVTAIGGGYYHSLAVRSDGSVWAWGSNDCGQLGNGTTVDSDVPVQVSNLSGVIAVAGGSVTSLALKSDGTVWSWGGDCTFQLTSPESTVPVQVANLTGVTAIAASIMDDHSLAIKSDGTLWAWGRNNDGELGNGTTTSSSVPVQVSNLSGVTVIAAGSSDSFAATSDGRSWAWGSNFYGQLACDGCASTTTPMRMSNLYWVTGLAAGDTFGIALAPPPSPPSAPLGLRAVPGSSIGSIDVTWNAPLSEGMHAITGYDIYRGTASGAETLLAHVGPTTQSYTDTGLTPLTSYYYDVTAVNPIQGPPSNEACSVPHPWTTSLPCSPL